MIFFPNKVLVFFFLFIAYSDQMRNPLISIVTVSYNAVDTIEETILSVINQTYSNIEYIIIDGGSTDGTVDVIKKYSDKIAYWVSEPDRGIYDAMNKGIKAATGEWINFMNSGDVFYTSSIVDDIVKALAKNKTEIIYGDTQLKYSWGRVYKKAYSIDFMNSHIPFSHQSCFINSRILKERLFDLQFKICADYNLFFQLYKEKKRFYYEPIIISIYEAEQGISSRNLYAIRRENNQISGKGGIFEHIYLICLVFYSRLFSLLKLGIPNFLLSYYRNNRYNVMK